MYHYIVNQYKTMIRNIFILGIVWYKNRYETREDDRSVILEWFFIIEFIKRQSFLVNIPEKWYCFIIPFSFLFSHRSILSQKLLNIIESSCRIHKNMCLNKFRRKKLCIDYYRDIFDYHCFLYYYYLEKWYQNIRIQLYQCFHFFSIIIIQSLLSYR